MNVLLVVGHSDARPGARNAASDLYEFQFNKPLVGQVTKRLQDKGVEAAMTTYQAGGGNVARWNGASDLLIEFHCNAFNREASGTEVLYAKGSDKGLAAAQILHRHLGECLGLFERGVKAKVRSDRGGDLLWGVRQVALIPEPFFIDNDFDLARAQDRDLADAYADGIEQITKAM